MLDIARRRRRHECADSRPRFKISFAYESFIGEQDSHPGNPDLLGQKSGGNDAGIWLELATNDKLAEIL